MNQWLYVGICGALACALVYILYRRGFAVSKSIAALLFVFQPGKDKDRAVLNSCTGWVQHAGRFRGKGTYAFSLDARLSGGTARAALLDGSKRPLLQLDPQNPNGRMELDGSAKYYLRWEFQSASGTCELRW